MQRGRRTPSIARPVVQFGLSGLAALVLLGLGATLVLRHLGRTEAIRDARGLTLLSGRGIVEPALDGGVLRGDTKALARLDRIVRRRILGGQVVRVKLWNPSGRIVYSDEQRLIGSRYALGQDERRVLASGAVEAELSDLSRPENRFERSYGKLLEVYLPIRTRGHRLLFEQYLRFSSIAASGRRIWTTFLPALVGALVLLELVQLPLAWSMARRMRVAHRQREAALAKAVEASQVERRRIARDLHDGPVQELAGMSFSLAAVAERIRARAPGDVVEAVRGAAAATRGTVRRLRSLLVEIYPPTLERAGLAAALTDVVAPASQRGLEVRIDFPDDFEASPEAESIVFRTAQEAVRNALAHAGASRLDISVARRDGFAVLEVCDDGRGFTPLDDARRAEGHFGLTLLEDLAQDVGGTLVVESGPDVGTTVRLEIPA